VKVLVTDMRHTSPIEEEKVLRGSGLELDTTFSRTEDELIEHGRGAIGFLVSYANVTRRVMEALPELRVIVKYGIGVDTIDLDAATDLGKYVANLPDYCTEEVALQALGLILCGIRQIPLFAGQVRAGKWQTDPEPVIRYRPSQETLGFVGFGRIARLLAKYMEAMVEEILFYDPFAPADAGAQGRYERVDDLGLLFERSRIVSVHAPLNDSTRGIVGREAIARARDAILVNTSRGGLVDPEAAAWGLENGKLSFFGTDVGWREPLDFADPLTKRLLADPRVLVTPHVGWCSAESARSARRLAAEEVLRVHRGEVPLNVVNKAVLAKLGRK
jgi:D-3-phosphoglycerate dehydrogenase / 2-oxoglutarate reductase